MQRASTLFFCVACIAFLLLIFASEGPRPDMSYRSVLSHLYKVNARHPVKLGLDNMHQLNKILGFPLKGIPIVHVAGTNGKGSVSLKIAKSLTAVGLKAGMFTSPHISSFRERIQVNDVPLSEQDVEVRDIIPYLTFLFHLHPLMLAQTHRRFCPNCSTPASSTACPRPSSSSPPASPCSNSSAQAATW